MSDASQYILQMTGGYALPIALVLLAFAIIIYLNLRKIKHNVLNLKTRRYLDRLGIKQISNLRCPNGLGHYFTIDRLILRHDGITLLIYKRYPGKIFCADQINEWTQMLGKKSYRFKNPLYDLDCQIKAVSVCIPKIQVNGFLFFDHLTEFPKGHPERIIYLENMPEQLKPGEHDEVDAAVLTAWEKLQLMVKN